MAFRALTTPCGSFPAGGVALPAFCPCSTSSFAALSQHRQPRGLGAATTSSRAVCNGSLLGTRSRRRCRSEVLRCGLTRLSGDAGHRVLPILATRDQWSHYWGGSEMQRVGKAFEVTAVAFLGLWACYFASFFLGVATMTVIGTSFLFYWLLAPNVTSFRRNRALRGRIAPFPGAEGNSLAIFRARVASATEEYHPVTGQPVFLRMVIEDEDGRALKFRTRTRAEYARVRPGMVAEAILVSPDERFDEILGVSDTYIPAANVWVGEYPYLDKVVMRRLLASRDMKRRQRRRAAGGDGDENLHGYDGQDYDDQDEELDPMTYRDSWTQTWPNEEPARRESDGLVPEQAAQDLHVASRAYGSDVDAYYGSSEEEEDDEPYFEGVGSAGFSMTDRSAGQRSDRQQWERVSGKPRPRRRPVRNFEQGGGGSFYSSGRRARGETGLRGEWDAGDEGRPAPYGGENVDDSRLAAGRRAGR